MQVLQHLLFCLLLNNASGDSRFPVFPTESDVITVWSNDNHPRTNTVCSHTKDGHLAWELVGDRIEATARGIDGVFYMASHNGTLTALTSDGKVKWKFTAQCVSSSGQAPCVSDAILIAKDETIYLTTQGTCSQQPYNNSCNNPGKVHALSPEGELIWSVPVVPGQYFDQWFLWRSDCDAPTLGKEASQDLVFTIASDGASVNAVAALSGSTQWSVPVHAWQLDVGRPIENSPGWPVVDVAADGTLLILVKARQLGHTFIAAYSPAGQLLWSRTFGQEYKMMAGADGTVYVAGGFYGAHEILAFTSKGDQKWNISFPSAGSLSAQNIQGDVFVTKATSSSSSPPYSRMASVVIVHPDGRQSIFHEFGTNVSAMEQKLVLAPDGSVYVAEDNFGGPGTMYALKPNGDEKWHFESQRVPTIANDGTAYILNRDGVSTPNFYAVDGETGIAKWKYQPGKGSSMLI